MARNTDGRREDVLPRLDWYPQDYLASRRTRVMTLAEHGAYMLLLWSQWIDGPLPSDPRELARLLGVTLSKFNTVWRRVSKLFRECGDGTLVNDRLERERSRALGAKAKAAENGRKGAKARWGEDGDPIGFANSH